ncbi:MAG: hypothetical protein QGG42_11440 [Phycisphaerae bacterium]|jgi:hypothetical protein|nr:hypothetical protein [Phycisphaerae bacterium]
MRLGQCLILTCIAISAISCNQEELRLAAYPRATIEQIDPLISWSSGSDIFPPSWLDAPFYQTARPIHPSEKDRARTIVRRALRKYPASLVAETIDEGRIYILGELKVYRSLQFSGTASHKAVYLVVRDKSQGYTDEFIESVFHQEYSTLLMNRHLKHLDQQAWKAVNPKGFAYMGSNSWDRVRGKDGGAKAITKTGGTKLLTTDAKRLEQGFLVRYSMSSLENDVNGYAAALFANKSSFWANVDKHPTVRKKTDLAVKFYHRVNPAFTEEYFRNLPR